MQKQNQALLIKIADDLNSCHDFQETLSDEFRSLKTEIQHLKDEQNELVTRVTEFITTKSSSQLNSNTISVELFQKKPKLASIHQLWWAVSNNNMLIYILSIRLLF